MKNNATRLTFANLTESRKSCYLETKLRNDAQDACDSGTYHTFKESYNALSFQLNKIAPTNENIGHRIVALVDFSINEEVGIAWWQYQDDNKTVIFWGLDVYMPFRRQGYAKLAIKLVERMVRDNGYKTIRGAVFASNTPSVQLHKSCGYEITSVFFMKTIKPGLKQQLQQE